MLKFAKNDRLDALIILVRDEHFFCSPLKMMQMGDHWMTFFYFLAASNDKIKQAYLLATSYFSLPFLEKNLDKKYQIYNNWL